MEQLIHGSLQVNWQNFVKQFNVSRKITIDANNDIEK
jgi:hypothetical protein